MAVASAFIGVVLIWGTTPLAVQWSLEGSSFAFAVMARMVLGVVLCLTLLHLSGIRLPRHRNALLTYTVGGLGIFGAMTSTYWSAQFIPSGWISILFGLSPLCTGFLAMVWLGERFGGERLLGTLVSLAGLSMIFLQGTSDPSGNTLMGIFGIVFAVSLYATSTVLVKKLGEGIPAFATTTGSLMVAVPGFILVWAVTDGQLPQEISPRAFWSILYLGVIASAIGFTLFYYVLEQLEAGETMLITLINPVIGIYLGTALNNEALSMRFIAGTGMILFGLAIYQWGAPLRTRLAGSKAGKLPLTY
ncbi:MAG: DMT family transporter [Magnetococcales bacterium]|nr:DMT family transporter [Magnetococcales bacterium]